MAVDLRLPSQVKDDYWISVSGPAHSGKTLGKWLLFVPITQIDDVWSQVRDLVASGAIKAESAKVSTSVPNPNANNEQTKVICVYTTESTIEEVGKLLMSSLPAVQKMGIIRFKEDAATLAGHYSNRGHRAVTSHSLKWNNGNMIFQKNGVDPRVPSEVTNTPWITIQGPSEEEVFGKWLVFVPIDEVDDLWCKVSDLVTAGTIKADSAKVATGRWSPNACSDETKVICVYTTEPMIEEVGKLLMSALTEVQEIGIIRYKEDTAPRAGYYSSRGDKGVTSHSLTWNNGQMIFE